jgi:hypothetical protein
VLVGTLDGFLISSVGKQEKEDAAGGEALSVREISMIRERLGVRSERHVKRRGQDERQFEPDE